MKTNELQESEGLATPEVSKRALIEILKSDSVYHLLRFGFKSPSKSGMDNQEDNGYIDLYHLVCKLRQHGC